MRVVCHGCRAVRTFEGTLSRREECDRCGADLRCCLNCRFHDESAYNQCRESSAERVLEKGRANFCDYFSAALQTPAAREDSDATSELEKLFKS